MEETVLVDHLARGRLVSLVVDSNGRGWKIEISSSAGYPPKYTAKVDKKKVPGGPFAEKEQAHEAALVYIEHQSVAASVVQSPG
jgi:hypothetical protein